MDLQLKSISGPTREHIYHCYEHHALQHSSIIDDIYIFSPPTSSMCTEQCKEVGENLDHKMLTQHNPAAIIQMAVHPKARASWPIIRTMRSQIKPDVIILTEIKLVSRMYGMPTHIQNEACEYQMHHSSITYPK